jgi:hypothetical protein
MTSHAAPCHFSRPRSNDLNCNADVPPLTCLMLARVGFSLKT